MLLENSRRGGGEERGYVVPEKLHATGTSTNHAQNTQGAYRSLAWKRRSNPRRLCVVFVYLFLSHSASVTWSVVPLRTRANGTRCLKTF
jgi:hypothetical protein